MLVFIQPRASHSSCCGLYKYDPVTPEVWGYWKNQSAVTSGTSHGMGKSRLSSTTIVMHVGAGKGFYYLPAMSSSTSGLLP